ncbi:MAG: signal peptide peptidase SppA [Bacteroidia bacterium]|jgi:protease-4
MKSFFKMVFASMLGLFLSFILFFLFIFILVSAGSDSDKVEIKDNSILHLTLAAPIPDRSSDNPFSSFGFDGLGETPMGLNDVLDNLDKAAANPSVKGIFLDLTNLNSGIATIEEIRNALIDFKKSEKFIYAYSEVFSQPTYYLATAADKIYLHPTGLAELKGLRSEILFFKGTLDKLGVEPLVFRHGKFKSAVEPFIQDKLSDSNREQVRTFLNSIWNHMLKGIAAGRKLNEIELRKISSELLVTNAPAAKQYKLVDDLKYRDEVLEILKTKTGAESIDKLELVTINDMKDTEDTREKRKGDKIAVVYAEGDIVDGEGQDGQIGSVGCSKAMRKARLDEKVKAVVLRVNSPGGSALASETIWREVMLTKKVKPVIVSMGNLAASGGYYIAAPADVIVASPNTITGSIGVFGLFFNGKGLANQLGVTIDTVKTTPMADIMSSSRGVTPREAEIIQAEIERIYDNFITRVAEGRKMSKADVDSIAQGRVWTGADAKRLKLVDEFGGLDRAIELAAQKAKLDNYRIMELPFVKDPLEKILDKIGGKSKETAIESVLGESYKYYKQVERVRNMRNYQTRMPYEIDVY